MDSSKIRNDKEEIYVKVSGAKFITVLQHYDGGYEKTAHYDGFNICLCKSKGTLKALTRQVLKISLKDLDDLCPVLDRANRDDPNLKEIISTGKNWKGQPTRLVLKRGGTNNSMVYLVKEWAEDDVDKETAGMNSSDNEDENELVPVARPIEIVDPRVWTENFDKFYFAALDNFSAFASIFRDLSHRINEYVKMVKFFKQQKQDAEAAAEIARVTGNSDTPTSSTTQVPHTLPFTPTFPPLPRPIPVQSETEDDSDFDEASITQKRKKAKSATARKPKKPKNYQFIDDQVLSTEDLHALSILYTFVHETKLEPHECILFYSSSMSNELKKLHGIVNFDYVRRILQRFSDKEIDELIDDQDKTQGQITCMLYRPKSHNEKKKQGNVRSRIH